MIDWDAINARTAEFNHNNVSRTTTADRHDFDRRTFETRLKKGYIIIDNPRRK